MPQLDVDAIVQTSKQYVIAVRITHPEILEEGPLTLQVTLALSVLLMV
jgi:hypothetical protein